MEIQLILSLLAVLAAFWALIYGAHLIRRTKEIRDSRRSTIHTDEPDLIEVTTKDSTERTFYNRITQKIVLESELGDLKQ